MKLHKEGNNIIPGFVIGVVGIYLLLTWLIPLEIFKFALGGLSAIFLFFVVWTLHKPVSLRMMSVDPFHTFLCPNMSP